MSVDIIKGPYKTIEFPHSKVHSGDFYSVSHVFGGVSPSDMFIQVGSNKSLHLNLSVAVEDECTLAIYEGTTVTAAGTSLTAYNNNRESSKTTDATATHTPTVNTIGTLIYADYIPAGSGVFSGGGNGGGPVRAGTEIILAKDEDYLIRVTPGAGTPEIAIALGYYEED